MLIVAVMVGINNFGSTELEWCVENVCYMGMIAGRLRTDGVELCTNSVSVY